MWKTRFILVLITGITASILVTLLSTRAIAWYFKPPVDFGVNCTEAVAWGMNRLQNFQLIGLLIGAALGLALSFRLGRASVSKDGREKF